METKHTSGKWVIDGNTITTEYGRIAEIELISDRINLTPNEQANANAKLIASAPEMLEVMQELLNKVSAQYLPTGVYNKMVCIIKQATE